MDRDGEIEYWRKLFHAAKGEIEKWKLYNIVISIICVMSFLANMYFIFR